MDDDLIDIKIENIPEFRLSFDDKVDLYYKNSKENPDYEPWTTQIFIDLPPPSGPVGLLVDYAHHHHIRAEVERSGTGGRIWR